MQFDAPRLLAHSYLFEADRFLNSETKGDFVRWMDDIDFGVNTREQGRTILRQLDELLLARGIRLNAGKTVILTSKEAQDYFLPDENRFLTVLKSRIERKSSSGKSITEDIRWLQKRLTQIEKTLR